MGGQPEIGDKERIETQGLPKRVTFKIKREPKVPLTIYVDETAKGDYQDAARLLGMSLSRWARKALERQHYDHVANGIERDHLTQEQVERRLR